MALRDKLTKRVQSQLQPGEQVEQIFMAQGGLSPYMVFVSNLVVLIAGKFRVIAVTNQGILIFKSSVWTPSFPKTLIARLPRQTRLGPVSGLWAKTTINGEKIWVNKRFHKDVEAADAVVTY